MLPSITIDPDISSAIMNAARADISTCYTCGSCAAACPINLATNHLNPRKIVRMANFGLLEELTQLPEIWYCLRCNQCNGACPMAVKPAALINYLREEVIRRQLVTDEVLTRYRTLCSQVQRLRWRIALTCLRSQDILLSEDNWRQWLDSPVKYLEEAAPLDRTSKRYENFIQTIHKYMGDQINVSDCLTCGGCSNACPACYNRGVFDPVRIIRMVNLGLIEYVIKSPEIWLCLGCQRCSETCLYGVKGYQIIITLRRLARDEGLVDEYFLSRWAKANNVIYSLFVKEIDTLFNFTGQDVETLDRNLMA
ncbi:MAG: 4Fe-4S dicluster domain-containing protein [Deltaproteobacteria bacterium]|nr:4Fe-4S dicluster domain-containing protein [Deltaproteobacteria bacterium]